MNWVENEVGNAQLGDERLTKRLINLTTAISERPESSLPAACGSWSETKAAYRFFSNERVSSHAVYESHHQATLDRINGHSIILAVQDTTTFNFTLHRKTMGLGPIGQAGLSGFFLHTSMAVSSTGVPLGVLAHQFWTRDPKKHGKKTPPKKRSIEDKESLRWLTLMKKSTEGIPSSTRVVMVGDRESDIFDLFVLATQMEKDFLIRAAWNRCLQNSEGYLFDEVKQSPVLGITTIEIPRSKKRAKRKATLTLRATQVNVRAPKHRQKEKLSDPSLYVIHACEEVSPKGEKPLEWFLLTSLPVSSLDDALRCLTWYTYRWRIERYHYILKSGCQVEELQLETQDRLEKAIAVYSIVAWRLLWLTYQARQSPEVLCTIALSENEWKALHTAIHRSPILSSDPPTVSMAVLWIAKLGGFLGRKSDGEPGAKVLWRGFKRLQDLTLMWDTLHQ